LVKDRIFINHKSPGVSVSDAQARLHLPSIPKIKPRLIRMNAPQFPQYQNANAAATWGCLQCLKPLNPQNIKNDGFANGRGRYCIKCDHCQMSTWFDIWDKSGNPIKGENH